MNADHLDRHVARQTSKRGRQTDRQTGKWLDRQARDADRHMAGQTSKRTRETNREIDTWPNTDKQDRHTDNIQTDRQTDRLANT